MSHLRIALELIAAFRDRVRLVDGLAGSRAWRSGSDRDPDATPRTQRVDFRMYSPDDVARLSLMLHYMRQQIAPSRAAALVGQARTAAVHDDPGIPGADVRKALRTLRDSLESVDEAPAERLLRRLTGVFMPGIVFRDVVLSYLRELEERLR